MLRILHEMSFRSRLFVLGVSMTAISASIGVFGQWTVVAINGVVIRMQQQQEAMNSLATQSVDALVLAQQVAGSTQRPGIAEFSGEWMRKREEITQALAAVEEGRLVSTDGREVFRKTRTEWAEISEALVTFARSGRSDGAVELGGRIRKFAMALNQMRADVFSATRENVAEAAAAQASNRNILIGAALVFVLFVFSAFRFTRSMVLALNQVGSELSGSANEIQVTSQQISVLGHALSELTSEQSRAVDETVASMKGMSTMMSDTSQNAQSAMLSAIETQRKADEGTKTIDQLRTSMDEIIRANEKLEEINLVIEEIHDKTKVINDIVAETRMLSFNASIEAARAGEHGRGFAVVAEQIGNLARMSGKAAQEIRMLIAKSTSQVNHSIHFTQEKVRAGQRISEACAMAFQKINDTIKNLTPLVNAIAVASEQQEHGITKANRAMQQMDLVANKNLRRASEAAQAGKRLEDQYGVLANSIGGLDRILLGEQDSLDRSRDHSGRGGSPQARGEPARLQVVSTGPARPSAVTEDDQSSRGAA